MFDFRNNVLICPSDSWKTLRDPMNAHFSPDGRRFVFMGVSTKTNQWDCFLYELDSGEEPRNLTESFGGRNEDPKWHPMGDRIVFKHDRHHLVETDESGSRFDVLVSDEKLELSMPCYTTDGLKVLFSASTPNDADIEVVDLETDARRKLYEGYYPIAESTSSFVFSGNQSPEGRHDQIYRGFVDGREPIRLAFNMDDADTSDPFPVGDGFYFVSSTRGTPRDIYKLFLADAKSGAVVPLSEINPMVNTGRNELGACFSRGE